LKKRTDEFVGRKRDGGLDIWRGETEMCGSGFVCLRKRYGWLRKETRRHETESGTVGFVEV
jgi:hypothetical protein